MPVDDPDDDEPSGPPLPPDDRLWRHPSELGREGERQQVVLVTRTVGVGRTLLVAGIAGLVGAAATLGLIAATDAFTEVREGRTSVERIETEAQRTPGESDLAIAERVLPAVATVRATGPAGTVTGTGVVFRADGSGGQLLTTAEVIDGAETVEVVLNDGSRVPGTLVGRSVESDVAVIAVQQPNLPVAARSGQGARFGLHTVIIDAGSQSRAPGIGVGFVNVDSREIEVETGRRFYGMVEVTTRSNVGPQSPGTVVVDESGNVVGIVSGHAERLAAGPETSTVDPSSTQLGNTFHLAIPADLLWEIGAQIVDAGQVVQPVSGLRGVALGSEDAAAFGVAGGVRLDLPPADSPAAAAGLRANDIVIGVENEPIGSTNDLVVAVRRHQAGEQIRISFLRDGERSAVLLTLDGRVELP